MNEDRDAKYIRQFKREDDLESFVIFRQGFSRLIARAQVGALLLFLLIGTSNAFASTREVQDSSALAADFEIESRMTTEIRSAMAPNLPYDRDDADDTADADDVDELLSRQNQLEASDGLIDLEEIQAAPRTLGRRESESYSSSASSTYSTDGTSKLNAVNYYNASYPRDSNRLIKNLSVSSELVNGLTEQNTFSGSRTATRATVNTGAGEVLDVTIGANEYRYRGSSSSSSPIFGLAKGWKFGDTDLSLDSSHDLFYSSSSNTAALRDRLGIYNGSLSIESRNGSRLKLRSSASYQSISDGNEFFGTDSGIFYLLSENESVWGGFGGALQHYAQSKWEYWTPKRNFSIGPRLEGSKQLSKLLSIHGSISLGCGNDEGGANGWGTYHEIGIAYNLSKFTLLASYVGMGSVFVSDGWFQHSLNIAGSALF